MKKSMITLAGAATSAMLVLAFAGPASASARPDPAVSPQLQAWLAAPATAASPASSASSASPASASTGTAKALTSTALATTAAAATAGSRLVSKRGSWLLWTENTLEWYWNSKAITSSTGWQSYGYVFPNTAAAGGITRTYKGSTQHNWRGTMIAGAGVITPWGAVNVYRTSVTDYFYLKRGGAYTIN